MELITKGFFVISLILVGLGVLLGREVAAILYTPIVSLIDESYRFYIVFFAIGIPLAYLNYVEINLIWKKIFGRKELDLLGISVGVAIGIITYF
jgi:hypothetical protein